MLDTNTMAYDMTKLELFVMGVVILQAFVATPDQRLGMGHGLGPQLKLFYGLGN